MEVLGGLPQHSKQKGVSSLGVISTPHPFHTVRDGPHYPVLTWSLTQLPRTLVLLNSVLLGQNGHSVEVQQQGMTEIRDTGHFFTVLSDFT